MDRNDADVRQLLTTLVYAVNRANECGNCKGRCCHDMLVPVNGFDVARIARAYALPAHEIVDAIDDESEDLGVFRSGSRCCSLALARNVSDPTACTFLTLTPAFDQRCAIHEQRPRVCAIFPMSLTGGAITVRANAVCAQSNWDATTLSHALWSGYIAQNAVDWENYGRVVARWNASPLADIDDGGATFLRGVVDACATENPER